MIYSFSVLLVVADGAKIGAGRVRGIIQPWAAHRLLQAAQDDPGLHRHQIRPADLDNAVQPGQDDDHPARNGHRTAGAPGPRPPGHHREPVLVRSRTIAATSAADPGRTTKSGMAARSVASYAYPQRSSGVVRRWSGPTIRGDLLIIVSCMNSNFPVKRELRNEVKKDQKTLKKA